MFVKMAPDLTSEAERISTPFLLFYATLSILAHRSQVTSHCQTSVLVFLFAWKKKTPHCLNQPTKVKK